MYSFSSRQEHIVRLFLCQAKKLAEIIPIFNHSTKIKVMKKNVTLTLLAMLLSAASFALTPITGVLGCCNGSTSPLRDTTTGGTWSTSNAAIASIDASSGMVYGISAGSATITYTLGSSFVTAGFTVSPSPAAIGGIPSVLCVGSTSTLTDASSGGTWSSAASWIASINTSTGVVTGVSTGSTTVNYTLGTGCSTSGTINVSGGGYLPDSISGMTPICVGSSYTFTISTTGGTWSSSNPSIASVNSTSGLVTGVSAGTANISYSITSSCGTLYTFSATTISAGTSAGTIGGTTTAAVGSSTTLTETVTGGTWSTSSASIASVNPSTGIVTGIAVGTVTISYTVSGCSGTATATTTVTITSFNGISGHVLFGGGAFYGNVKVWLITYNTSTMMLQAIDSVLVTSSGSSVYYEFLSAATDSYRIKAAVIDTSGWSTGYIPTYHTSSYYWHSATVLMHTTGTSDINQDINMAYGSTTAGPGFIGGNVTTGANKGTSTSIPAVNLRMLLVNTSTNTMIAQTLTDASGNYSFSNLPVGQTYMVFPEQINYATTAYIGIALTTSSASRSAIGFIQHTISKTITPVPESVISHNNDVVALATYPNPVTGKLNIQWNEAADEKGTVVISTITGNEVYNTTINMTQGAGATSLDLSGLSNGLYIITIKAGAVSYTNKVQVQH